MRYLSKSAHQESRENDAKGQECEDTEEKSHSVMEIFGVVSGEESTELDQSVKAETLIRANNDSNANIPTESDSNDLENLKDSRFGNRVFGDFHDDKMNQFKDNCNC